MRHRIKERGHIVKQHIQPIRLVLPAVSHFALQSKHREGRNPLVTPETLTQVCDSLTCIQGALEEAALLPENDHTNTFVDRLDNAYFDTVSAL